MSNNTVSLSPGEWQIMDRLWEKTPRTLMELVRILAPDTGWSKSTIASLIVGWKEDDPTVVLVPTVPDLSGCGDPEVLRRADILKAYHEKMMDSLVIYPDKKGYTALKTFSWLEDEKLYIYVDQEQEEKDFRDFFLHIYATK